jgi:hypothetical protein
MPPKITRIELDYTTASNYRRCPRKAFFENFRGLRPKDSTDALAFGQILHAGLESLYTTNLDTALAHIDTEAATTPLRNIVPTERRSIDHAKLLLTRYSENYFPDVISPTFFETTHRIKLSVLNDVEIWYGGTLDMLESPATGEPRVIETKTTSYLGSSFMDRCHPNDQGTGYCILAADKLARPVHTILFNGISTSGYGLKSDAAKWPINSEPSKLFLRMESHRTDDELEDFRFRMVCTAKDILRDFREFLNSGNDAYDYISCNPPDACTMFNTTCPYIDLCRAKQETRETLIRNTLIHEPWRGFRVTLEGADA